MRELLTLLGGLVGFLFGSWSITLTIFLVVQLLDLLSVVLKHAKLGKLNSAELKLEIINKVGVWLILVLAHFIDVILFAGNNVVQTAITFTLIGQEGISILENLNFLGIQVPQSLAKYFKNIEAKGEINQEQDKDK